MDVLANDLLAHAGLLGPGGPAAARIADSPQASFVLKQQAQGQAGRSSRWRFLEELGEFLKGLWTL